MPNACMYATDEKPTQGERQGSAWFPSHAPTPSTTEKRSECPALVLPTELWIYILQYFSRCASPSARRQLYYISLVSSSFHTVALPLLYSHLTLSAYIPLAIRSHCALRTPMVKIPAVTTLRTLASRPDLHNVVKSVQFLGHIDTVVLSRRTSARTSDILEANGIRDLFVSTLPLLTSLNSISFSAVALTSKLCNALFFLPRLEQLSLKDCRAPVPASAIFCGRPGEIKLKHVELVFGAWTDTAVEVGLLSTFVYGPDLTTLTTDQPRVLASLLTREFTTKLRRLELRRFREEDGSLVREFLSNERCSALKALVLDDCAFSRDFRDADHSFPSFPELQMYSGPHELAHRFFATQVSLQHIKLSATSANDDHGGVWDLNRLATLGRTLLSLDIQLYHELYLIHSIWVVVGRLFPMLRVLRIEHNVPPKLFQTHVLPKCLTTLPAMAHLEKLTLVAPEFQLDPLDDHWQSAAVRDLAECQPTLRAICLSRDNMWIRLGKGEWKMVKMDEL
ncbi:hypothetical protein JB92DRAFT_1619935 [Gautieria morchelliformis]|nr:hypothetical protein JB92DRAFT_1619935 [Gautieria morchelliformis]